MTPTTIDPNAPVMTFEEQLDARVLVILPEEPDSYVSVSTKHGTRMLRFQNGRLIDRRDKLTEEDIAWFERYNQQLGRERFIIVRGRPDTLQYSTISERMMDMVAKKAGAQNPGKVTEDWRFAMAALFAGEDGIPQIIPLTGSVAEIARRSIAGFGTDPSTIAVVDAEKHAAADQEAILRGLQTMGDDTPLPESRETSGVDVDNTPLPSTFAPPVEATKAPGPGPGPGSSPFARN